MDKNVSPERLPSSPTKINHGLNEPSTSANFSLTPQVNDVMEEKNTPLDHITALGNIWTSVTKWTHFTQLQQV